MLYCFLCIRCVDLVVSTSQMFGWKGRLLVEDIIPTKTRPKSTFSFLFDCMFVPALYISSYVHGTISPICAESAGKHQLT